MQDYDFTPFLKEVETLGASLWQQVQESPYLSPVIADCDFKNCKCDLQKVFEVREAYLEVHWKDRARIGLKVLGSHRAMTNLFDALGQFRQKNDDITYRVMMHKLAGRTLPEEICTFYDEPINQTTNLQTACTYWREHVRDLLSDYPQLPSASAEMPADVKRALGEFGDKNVAVMVGNGGMPFRAALAAKACAGMESSLDVGTGDGYMLPFLATYGSVHCLEPVKGYGGPKICSLLSSEYNIKGFHEEVKHYKNPADVVVVSHLEYVDPKNMNHLIRLAKKRLALGILPPGPLHCAEIDQKRKAGTQYSFKGSTELKIIERNLRLTGASVTSYCFNNTIFALIADLPAKSG